MRVDISQPLQFLIKMKYRLVRKLVWYVSTFHNLFLRKTAAAICYAQELLKTVIHTVENVVKYYLHRPNTKQEPEGQQPSIAEIAELVAP